MFVQALEAVDSTRIGAWNGRLLMVRLFWKEVRYLPGALSAARRYQSEAELPEARPTGRRRASRPGNAG